MSSYDSIERSCDDIIYFRSFGTLAQISRICKEDSFPRQSFVSSQWRKIFGAPRSKGWSDVLLMIRLLLSVRVSNAKLERMFSKLKRIKTNFRWSLSNVWKIFWKLWNRVAVRRRFTQCQQQRSGALIKLGAQARRKNCVATNHVILLKWTLNLSVMMTMGRKIFLSMGTTNVFFWFRVN